MSPNTLEYLLKKEQEKLVDHRSSVQTAPESLEQRTPDDSILGFQNESFMQSDMKSQTPNNPFGSALLGSQLEGEQFESAFNPGESMSKTKDIASQETARHEHDGIRANYSSTTAAATVATMPTNQYYKTSRSNTRGVPLGYGLAKGKVEWRALDASFGGTTRVQTSELANSDYSSSADRQRSFLQGKLR